MKMIKVFGPPQRPSLGVAETALRKFYPCVGKSQICAVIFLLFFSACTDNEARQKQVTASQQLAYAFIKEGRTSNALTELVKAEALDPKNAEVKSDLALAYWLKHEYGLAEKKYKEAVELKPDYAEAWHNLGVLYIDQSRYQEALEPLRTAAGNIFYQTPEFALTNLGYALYKLGNYNEAQQKLKDALSIAPDLQKARLYLGMVLQNLGDHKAALENLGKAADLYPGDQQAFFHQGISRLKTGDKNGAQESFDRAWKLNPEGELGKSARTYLDIMQK